MSNWGQNVQLGIPNWGLEIGDWELGWHWLKQIAIDWGGWNGLEYDGIGGDRPIPAFSCQFPPIFVYSSLFQLIPAYSSPFLNSSLFQPILAYSSLFQHVQAYFSLFKPIPAYSSLFQPISQSPISNP